MAKCAHQRTRSPFPRCPAPRRPALQAIGGTLLYRVGPLLPASFHRWLAVTLLSCVANAAWRRACRGAPGGGSYARYREPLVALLFITNAFGGGQGGRVCKAWLDTITPPAAAISHAAAAAGGLAAAGAALAAAQHTALLLLISFVPHLVSLWVARPVRLL